MGQKRSLCIGINQYGGNNQLSGCVNDANTWARFFQSAGFQVQLLLDGDATYNGIVGAIESIVNQSGAGDVIAVQYAGHGTNIPDTSGDEIDGQDEAIVPIDFASSDVIVDDVIGPLFDRAAAGVGINVFFDSCFSGGATRLLVQTPSLTRAFGGETKARFMPPTEAMIARHRERQRELRRTRGLFEANPRMREVLFAACQPNEKAQEINGHGVFTTAAMAVLQSGSAGLTNTTFIQNVVTNLGSGRPQTPQLSCADGTQGIPLFSIPGSTVAASGSTATAPQLTTIDDIIAALNQISNRAASTAPQRNVIVPPTPSPAESSYSIEDLVAGLRAIACAGRALRHPN